MERLDGKVAVVTGGASGIGRAIAAELVERGAKVVIADVEQATLEGAGAELGVPTVLCDVSSSESVQALANEAVRLFGKVDLYCSNAGVASTARIGEMRPTDWEWLLGVNLWGALHGISAFLPLLRANPEGGHLAFTASMSSFHVTPGIGGYTVTKFALAALAETLAAELSEEGENVGLTLLCPGPVSSRLGESQRNRREGAAAGSLIDSNLEASEEGKQLRWLEPRAVAKLLVRAIQNGDLYAFTHAEWAPLLEARHRAIEDAFERIPKQ